MTKEGGPMSTNNKPNRLIAEKSPYLLLVAEHPDQCKDIAPFAADYRIIDGKTTVYICENFACQQPTTNIEEAIHTLISSRD